MTDLLPIIEGLRDAGSHQERSDWLHRCPEDVFGNHHLTLSTILRAAGLPEGEIYVAAMMAKVKSTRLADGSIPIMRLQAVHIASTDLKLAARREGQQ